jgi:hypothetical protein
MASVNAQLSVLCTANHVDLYANVLLAHPTTLIIIISSVVQWSEFLATNPEVPVLIPDTTRFSEK